jgi:hypothetical protein
MAHQKVLFRLGRDDEGYPPADVEGVWAEETGDGGFIIDNIPFFTREATLGDVVEATRSGDELFYASTRERSGNSLLRVVFFGGHDPSGLRSELAKLGCSTEQSHLQSLIAVNVPPAVNIEEVRALLDDGSSKGCWDYEEPILRQ